MDLYLDIVSLKKRIFSGFVKKIRISGSEGELGIYPKHAQLLSIIKPGIVYISHVNNKKEECLYISGGILEVQPYVISILADVVIHAADLNREHILQTKKNAEENIKIQHEQSKKNDILLQISKEIAKLRALEIMDKFK